MSLYRAIYNCLYSLYTYIGSVILLRTVCVSHNQPCLSFMLATCTVYDDKVDNYRERDVKRWQKLRKVRSDMKTQLRQPGNGQRASAQARGPFRQCEDRCGEK